MHLNKFIKDRVEQAIHSALHPVGMHTNGPCIAHIEVTLLQRLLMVAESASEAYDSGYAAGCSDSLEGGV